MKIPEIFIWETHGIHVGTGKDHIKHGIDDIESVVENAVSDGIPSLAFVIHSPRLTGYRYKQEQAVNVKFVRGHSSYFNYSRRMQELRRKYGDKIDIRYGVELDWLGSGLGLQWNRAKLFQADGADFVIGSVHFSREGIPYDGSTEETEEIIKIRGGIENLWLGYLDEMIEMVDTIHSQMQVVGHLDLPKRFTPLPEEFLHMENSSGPVTARMMILLEKIRDYNLALDFNLSGLRQGCGAYPDAALLKEAFALGIPVAIGTDTHSADELFQNYDRGIEYLKNAGYRYYVSFFKKVHRKRPLILSRSPYLNLLNTGNEMLNFRFENEKRLEKPHISLGGLCKELKEIFPEATMLGSVNAVRLRKANKSVTVTDKIPAKSSKRENCLYSHHKDIPGTLSILFNMLASEAINVENAQLYPLEDGTASAYLKLSGEKERITEAVEFVRGTAEGRFLEIIPEAQMVLPGLRNSEFYLLSVDGVDISMAISKQMIFTIHNNVPGVILILLSALAARGVNVIEMQLGKRGTKQYTILGVEGKGKDILGIKGNLGPQFYEFTYLELLDRGI